jgi:hypothetical protein
MPTGRNHRNLVGGWLAGSLAIDSTMIGRTRNPIHVSYLF